MLIRAPDADLAANLLLSPVPGFFLGAWEAPTARRVAIALASGAPVPRPVATLRLERPGRSARHVAAFRCEAGGDDEILIRDGAEILLASPVRGAIADPAPLLQGLDAALKAQLLRFLLGYCRSAFRLSADRDFAAFAKRLALAAAAPGAPLVPFARIGSIGTLWHGPLETAAPPHTVFLVESNRVGENVLPAFARAESGEIALATASDGRADAVAVLAGEDTLSCRVLSAARSVPSIVERAERRELGPAERYYALRFLGTFADHPQAAQIARSLALGAGEAPRRLVDAKRPIAAELELVVDCGEAGVFARGWLRDPHALVSEATLVSPFGERSLSAVWHRLDRPDVERRFTKNPFAEARHGFIARLADLREPIPALQHRLVLTAAGAPIEPRLGAAADDRCRGTERGSGLDLRPAAHARDPLADDRAGRGRPSCPRDEAGASPRRRPFRHALEPAAGEHRHPALPQPRLSALPARRFRGRRGDPRGRASSSFSTAPSSARTSSIF